MSDIVSTPVVFNSAVHAVLTCVQKSEIHVAPLCIVNKLEYLVLPGKIVKIICV